MSASPGPASERPRAGLAALVVAPALVLALPFAFAYDPLPHASAAGWALLASLPGAVWLLRGAALRIPRAAALLALPAAAALIAFASGRATDGFELRRALCHAAAALIALLGGAALPAAARAWLPRVLAATSLAFTLPALFPLRLVPYLAGSLGNTGALSQAAIAGAAAGAWLGASASGPWRALGILALLCFALHAGSAPVIAGGLALGAALTCAALLPRQRTVGQRLVLLFPALLCAVAVFTWPRHVPEGALVDANTAEASVADASAAGATTGGAGVRLALWASVPRALYSHRVAGFGPGQFQAAYPPFRDPDEIERSTHGRALGATSEVEHLHDDWLQGLLEWGAVGGLAWIGFLFLVGRAAWRALRADETAAAPLALASLALLANALMHAPLTYNAASAVQACACFGALLASEPRSHALAPGARSAPVISVARAALLARSALAALVLLALWPAVGLVWHGLALAQRNRIVAELDRRAHETGMTPERLAVLAADASARELAALESAVRAASGSALAHGLLARSLAGQPDGRARAIEAWTRALELRPHSVEALLERSRLLALEERFDEARADVERAFELDAENPTALQNGALIEIQDGRAHLAIAYFDALDGAGRLDLVWLGRALAFELHRLSLEQGLFLAARVDPRAASGSTYELSLLGDQAEARGEAALASAYAALAHWSWGREHAGARNWETAARSYRQADLALRRIRDEPAPHLRLELAAAEAVAGNLERARDAWDDVPPGPRRERAVEAAPEWASAALREIGLLAP